MKKLKIEPIELDGLESLKGGAISSWTGCGISNGKCEGSNAGCLITNGQCTIIKDDKGEDDPPTPPPVEPEEPEEPEEQ